MARLKYEVMASNGEYKDREGNTKKRWKQYGAAYEQDDGRLSIRLDAIPVGPNWSGWFQLFEPKDRQQGSQQSSARDYARESGGRGRSMQDMDDESEIPF